MNPITSAIVKAVAHLEAPGVQQPYQALKQRLQQYFGDQDAVSVALANIEKKPEAWKAALDAALSEVQAAQNPVIMAAAEQLQVALQQQANISVGGDVSGENVNIGGTQTITDQSIHTGGGDYVAGNQQKGGSGNVQQNIGHMSGGTVIGKQSNYGNKKPKDS